MTTHIHVENKDASRPVRDIYYDVTVEAGEFAIHFESLEAADAAFDVLHEKYRACEQRNQVIVVTNPLLPEELGGFLYEKGLIGRACLAELRKDIKRQIVQEDRYAR